MNRFKLYVTLLALNIVLFLLSIVFKFQDFAGIVSFVSFLASIIFFLFTVEEPPKHEKLKIPEVHNRYRSAQNNYNNIVAVEFAILSFLFFILIYSTQISLVVAVILLWVISVPVTYYIIASTSKNREVNKIIDYIRLAAPEIYNMQTRELINKFFKTNSIDRSELIRIAKSESSSTALLVDLYVHYMQNRNKQLTSGEIEEINDL